MKIFWAQGFRRLVLIGLCLFVVLLVLGSVPYWMLQLPFHVLLGWFFFMKSHLSAATLDWTRCLTSLLVLLVAVLCLHGLIFSWRKRLQPVAPPWRWRSSLALIFVSLALAVAAIVFVGGIRQTAWLREDSFTESQGAPSRMRFASQARTIMMTARQYAAEHDGKYPDDLITLAEWAIRELQDDRIKHYLLFQASPASTPEPWLYFGRGLTDSDPGDTLVIASPHPVKGRRIAGHLDGAVSVLPEGKIVLPTKR